MADETRDANVKINADVSNYSAGTQTAYQDTNRLNDAVNKLTASLDGITKRMGKKLLIFSAADLAVATGMVSITAKYEKQLATLRAQMERHFQDNRTYATAGTFTTPCASTDAAPRTFGSFLVSCSGTPSATAFTLQAVGSGTTNGFTFTITEADVRATTAAPTGYNTCASKWLLKKGEAC